jgi:SAM-dependent methyltransferase
MTQDYKEIIKHAVLDEQTFVKLTMKGLVRGPAVPWQKIVVRPVLVRGKRHLQISYFDARQDISKNYRGQEALDRLDEALAIPFSSIVVQSIGEDLQVQLTKKGKAIVHHHRRDTASEAAQPLAHNRAKALPLPDDRPDAFLEALGVMNSQGQVKPHMQGKLAQINEFLKLVEATGELERFERSPIEVLDCGCGSSYLTFALYHYLNHVRGIPARLLGVDVNQELIEKSAANAEALGYDVIGFECAPIVDVQPAAAPDLVIALHACDTATDEAIAQAIRWDAHMLVCAPCCHHDLNDQIAAELFGPVLRHGILKQRMADILTDTFRALALRIMGYRADVIEFVAAEHTAKNLMIRAIKAAAPGERRFVREYNDLKQFWSVTPHIEKLLGAEFQALLNSDRDTRHETRDMRHET